MKRALLLLVLAPALSLRAANEPAATDAAKPVPGHSMQGDAFNEGPRQAAVLMSGTGDLHFPITTKSELAQKFFLQGVGQLHGFWYFEAERSFRQAAALDPECAMAYWGMARANANNAKRAAEFTKKAVALKEKVSRREQLWIDSLAAYHGETKADEKQRREAVVKALEELSFAFPDDLEAKAFLVFQLWENKNHGVPYGSRQAVEAIAQQVLAANPMHPGAHHYLIHLWNYSAGDKRALPSAARCGQAAPGIAHMWHMPGHTFSQLRRYADGAWQQEASARVDHAYMIRSRVLPDQIHNFAHNNEWLVKNLGFIGRVHDAVDLAKNMIELPRVGPRSAKSYQFGRERLLETLVRFELWEEIIALAPSIYLEGSEKPADELRRRRALGIAHFQQHDHARGDEQIKGIEELLKKAREERIAAADQAEAKAKKEKKPEDQIARAMAEAMRGVSPRITQAEAALAELRARRALASNDPASARAQLDLATDVPSERLSRLRFETGDHETALKLARELAAADEAQVHPLANLADLCWRANKKSDAIAAFEKLRKNSAYLDLDVPVFARLAPIVEELKLASDWRVAPTPSADSGVRPELASLGPFRWRPSPAPSWTLYDQNGQHHSLAAYEGKPVLVVFYLGSGCAGCIEQLNVFEPLAKQFAEAGISLVAVSTDSADALHETFAKSKDGDGFPFPILADPELGTFKAYRAFDDFEKIALHGAFLIDGRGLVRWQNIGYQPFRDAQWLLGEAKRLLRVPAERLDQHVSR